MKQNALLILVIACLFSSCKKFIQQQEQKAAMSIITNGIWYVSRYQRDTSDITASFSGYNFKFNSDGTVAGTRNSVATPGSWSADIASRTITANFPGAGVPLVNLNATWKIKDSYNDSVAAKWVDTVGKVTNFLQLKKR